jgi:hypothetical protein
VWKEENFKKWMNSEISSCLFLQGKPASGKSVMAKYVAQDLLTRPKLSRDSILTKYFFNDADFCQENNHITMLQSILSEILEQDHTFFCHFQRHYRDNKHELTQSGWCLEWLLEILRLCRQHTVHRHVYVILDGLDESSNYQETAKIIEEFKASGTWKMKLLLTSRSEPAFRAILNNSWKILLQEKNTPDIENYTSSFLRSDISLREASRKRFHGDIVKMSQNIFLWVELVRMEFCEYEQGGKISTDAAFEDFLSSLPQELDAFYQQMLERLASCQKQDHILDRRSMFQLVQFAVDPLTPAEFNDAIALLRVNNVNAPKFILSKNRTLQLADWIAKCSANFIEIRGESPQEREYYTARYICTR